MPSGIYKRTGEGFWKGKKLSISTRLKMSKVRKGKPSSEKQKEHLKKARKNKKFGPLSENHKKNLSIAKKGKPSPWVSARKGDKNPNWKGGLTPELELIRKTKDYKIWRTAVFTRDNYICVWCKAKGGWSKEKSKQIVLNADHIKPFRHYPELRFAIDNGRTLCVECHKTTETYGNKSKYYE